MMTSKKLLFHRCVKRQTFPPVSTFITALFGLTLVKITRFGHRKGRQNRGCRNIEASLLSICRQALGEYVYDRSRKV